jgi:hypothetical protein
MEQKKDVFEKLKNAEAVSMLSEEYAAAIQHMDVTRKLCFMFPQTMFEEFFS